VRGHAGGREERERNRERSLPSTHRAHVREPSSGHPAP
jgi:hypothetical protein